MALARGIGNKKHLFRETCFPFLFIRLVFPMQSFSFLKNWNSKPKMDSRIFTETFTETIVTELGLNRENTEYVGQILRGEKLPGSSKFQIFLSNFY